MKTKTLVVLAFACSVSALGQQTQAPDKTIKAVPENLPKGAGLPRYTILNINNITAWSRSDGHSAHSPAADNGIYYPRGTANVVYQDGIVWGGKVYLDPAHTQPAPNQIVRVGGGTYAIGTRAGWVNGSGATAVAEDPNHPDVRMYRIRRDYKNLRNPDGTPTQELIRDAAEMNEIRESDVTDAQIASVEAQYELDWLNWPVNRGAPFIDRNRNGSYDPPPPFGTFLTVDSLIAGGYDEPGIAGIDPNFPADQVIWTVYNDLNEMTARSFAGSDPLGLEIQKTVWGYERTDAFGNMYFSRYKIINRGGVDIDGAQAGLQAGSFYIDSMYICQWSDPDLGSFSDDVIGCDSVRSIGYVYNSDPIDDTFRQFNLAPPSAAYDFFAGPIVPSAGDTAVFDFKYRFGYRNLGMSSFAYFSAGSPYSDPPNLCGASYLCTSGQWWKMLRGFAPSGDMTSPDVPYAHPPGFPVSKYPLSGDPLKNDVFIDGKGETWSFAAGDRRILCNTGPFQLAPGDTQEIVVAFVAGLGSDRLSSVSVMKYNDWFAQSTYDALLRIPGPPASPVAKVAELDGEIILEWGSNPDRVAATEETLGAGNYSFEGYNVYQLPAANSTYNEAVRIATFDLTNNITKIFSEVIDPETGFPKMELLQEGTDGGIERSIRITRDYREGIDPYYGSRIPLHNGTEYYYAVTAYNYSSNPDALPRSYESDFMVLRAKPKIPFGVIYSTQYGDTLAYTHPYGASDGAVYPIVIDAAQLTGNLYRVTFDSLNRWTLTNVSTNTVLLANQTNQSGDEQYLISQGFQPRVVSDPIDAKDFQHTQNPSGAIVPPSYVGFSTFNSWGFPDPDPSRGGAPIMDFGGGRWGVHTGGAGAGGDESYQGRFRPRVFRTSPYSGTDNFARFVPNDYELRFTAAGGKAYLAFTTGAIIDVPFEIWCIGSNTPTNTADDYRMIPWINDSDSSGTFNLLRTDHAISASDNDPYTDWIYWMEPNPKTPGQAGYNAFVADLATYDADVSVPFPWTAQSGTGDEVMARFVLCNVNGGSVTATNWPANVNSLMPLTGNVIRLISTKPNTTADVFEFTTPTATTGSAQEKASADRILVFPNPYYAGHDQETAFNRFVTFNNLPKKVKIRIFNVAGHLVRVLEKDDPSQFLKWDLTNQHGWQVGSGMYICYVEMPEIGITKIVKAAIIQGEVMPAY